MIALVREPLCILEGTDADVRSILDLVDKRLGLVLGYQANREGVFTILLSLKNNYQSQRIRDLLQEHQADYRVKLV